MRAPFQILVIPYRLDHNNEPSCGRQASPPAPTPGNRADREVCRAPNQLLYAIFKRSDMDCWQFIAGGGDDDETAIEAAKRESFEEARIDTKCEFTRLKSESMIPASVFSGHNWPKEVVEIPEFCFSVRLFDPDLVLSDEHSEQRWVGFREAFQILKFESNRKALRELDSYLSSR